MSEEACSFFGVMSHQVLVSLKAIGVVAWEIIAFGCTLPPLQNREV